MRKLYVNGQVEANLRKNVGKKFNKRVNKQRGNRARTKKSSKEQVIADILTALQIEFISEYAPEGLVNPLTFHPLYYDFFLPTYNVVIEYDGAQHYKPIHGKKQLSEYQYRDKIKTLYCRYKSIRLLRIPYTCQHIEQTIQEFLYLKSLDRDPGQ
jgi:very-short-patch-repair endonuclease